MVLVKNWQIFHIFISAKKWQENAFYDILERENNFVDKKKKQGNKVEKIGIFLKS